MDMREKLARALAAHRINTEWMPSDVAGRAVGQVVDERWPHWLDEADVVLEAIREPTQEMIEAANWMDGRALAHWQAMVDAAKTAE